MDSKTLTAIDKIVKDNMTEILSRYFTKDIVRKIVNETMPGIEWDIGNMDEN
jgi:hypothetical protein